MAGEQDKELIAFLGPKASYTHQAALNRFPTSEYQLLPQTTIEEVFAAVQSGSVSRGVVPFENSSNGSVVLTLDLFADAPGRYPDILVGGEVYLDVHHCLVGYVSTTESKYDDASQDHGAGSNGLPRRPKPKPSDDNAPGHATPTQAAPAPKAPRSKPVHDVTHLRKLYSHPQAWGQCKSFLSTYLKLPERLDVSSTSRAAELVAQDSSGTSAAVSSRMAGELNGLEVLAEGIEDRVGNCTRFFVIQKGVGRGLDEGEGEGERGKWKSLVAFTVDHEEAGALALCLAVFKKYGLNLTSINTRPSGEAAWHYIFFVEFMGRKLQSGGAVNNALRDLDKVAQSWRWLGSWENAGRSR